MASGENSTFRQVGIATGIAGLGAVFQSEIVHRTLATLSTTPVGREVATRGGSQLNLALTAGQVQALSHSSQVPPIARAALLHAYRVGFSATLNELMLIGGVLALVGAAFAYWLVRQRDFVAGGVAGGATKDSGQPGTDPSREPGYGLPAGVGTQCQGAAQETAL